MKKNLWVYSSILVVLIAFGAFSFYLLPRLLPGSRASSGSAAPLGYSSDAVRALILEIEEEGTIQLGDVEQTYQILLIRIEEGEYKGLELSVDYGKRQLRPEGLNLSPGDKSSS